MIAIIRRMPPSIEMMVVLLLSLGLPIYTSVQRFFEFSSTVSSKNWLYRYTDMGIYLLTIYELIILFILVPLLFIRDWRLKDFNLHFSLRLVGVAFLLLIASNILSNLSYKAFSVLHLITPELEKAITVKYSITFYGLISLLVINSIFEESIVVGYLFKRLEKMSGVLVISFSIIIRQLYHLYQGPIAFLGIVPMGLVFGLYYWKYKQLTPLIIAHGLSNLFTYLGDIYNLNPPS
jgi:membrane protease YdiL (CAAX protease family)